MLALRRAVGLSTCMLSRPLSSIGTRVTHAANALKKADAVCFDVDSTVITSEGIDDVRLPPATCQSTPWPAHAA